MIILFPLVFFIIGWLTSSPFIIGCSVVMAIICAKIISENP